MKKIPLLISLIYFTIQLPAQNVGIGTANPQNKLHVAGGVRIDALNGAAGIVTKNTSGDLSSIAYTGNPADILNGNGSFSPLSGLTSGVLTSKTSNNIALVNAGYALIGEIPQVLSYSTINSVFYATGWQPTYTRGIPTNESAPVYDDINLPLAIWTGSVMYVVAPSGTYSYNPDSDIWILLSSDFRPGAFSDKILWTGSEIILWSGEVSTGKKYNPSTNVITIISTTNAPTARNEYSITWDGTRVIVWGGVSGGTPLNTGAMYDPAADTWTTMSNALAPEARQKHTAVWCNNINQLIVWGGSTSAFSGEINTGGIFDPASNSWTGATNIAGAPGSRSGHTAIWTGTEMIVFGGQYNSGTSLNTGGRYNPSTNTWGAATSTTGAPLVSRHATAWTGNEMYISGGLSGDYVSSYLYTYNPVLNTWVTVTGFNESKYSHYCFYKSNMLVVWGGKEKTTAGSNFTNTGFRYFLSNTASSATTVTSGTLYLYQKN